MYWIIVRKASLTKWSRISSNSSSDSNNENIITNKNIAIDRNVEMLNIPIQHYYFNLRTNRGDATLETSDVKDVL